MVDENSKYPLQTNGVSELKKPTEPYPADPGSFEVTLADVLKSRRTGAEFEEMMGRLHGSQWGEQALAHERKNVRETYAIILDARKAAEKRLAKATSDEAAWRITRKYWELSPKARERILISDLHDAIWTEGYPSLKERAEELAGAPKAGFTKASPAGEAPPCCVESTRTAERRLGAANLRDLDDPKTLYFRFKQACIESGIKMTEQKLARAVQKRKWNTRDSIMKWKLGKARPGDDEQIRKAMREILPTFT